MRILAKVSSYSALLAELQKARDKALKGAGEKAVDVAKDRVDKDVYATYNPKQYNRTGQLRDSIDASEVKSSGNTAEVKISHNTDEIHATPPNQHYSVVDGKSSVESIAEIVHNGRTGAIGQSGYWKDAPWYDEGDAFAVPRPYMDNAREELENGKYKNFMKEELIKQGYKVK